MSLHQALLASYAAAGGGGEDAVVFNSADKSTNIVLTNSDRTAETNSGAAGGVRASVSRIGPYKGYFEFRKDVGSTYPSCGICTAGHNLNSGVAGGNTLSWATWLGLGWVRYNNSTIATLGALAVNDILMVAVDLTTGKIWFGKNNSWSGNPAAGTGEASAAVSTSTAYYPVFTTGVLGDKATLNAETAQLAYAPPAGFSAWSIP